MGLYPYQALPDDWDSFYCSQRDQNLVDELSAFYETELPEAEQLVSGTDFVALDIETTGLNARQDEIVSIGLVPFDYRKIYLASARHWLVSSERLTSESVVIHGITHSEVATAPELSSVLPEVISLLKGRQIVVHHRYMEREFFRRAAALLYKQNWLFPVIDTLELESHFLRDQQSIVSKWLRRPLDSLRLPSVRERYNLPAYENHNALVDALATAELLQAQIAKQNLADRPLRELWQ